MSLRVCRSVGRRSQVGYAMRETVMHRFAPELLRGCKRDVYGRSVGISHGHMGNEIQVQ